MTASAADDLRDLDRHRAILRDGLQVLCREQRRLLREIVRSSRLPDGLGDLSRQPAHQRARAGLARTWQSLELFDDLTVYDNCRVAAERVRPACLASTTSSRCP